MTDAQGNTVVCNDMVTTAFYRLSIDLAPRIDGNAAPTLCGNHAATLPR
jgi:hypothetical protein